MQDPSSNNKPLISRPLASMLLAMALVEATAAMTVVQIPIFLRELGADIRQIGLFFTLSLIFPFVLRVIGGWVSDSIGRVRAMWFGSLVGVFAYVPYALAPSWQVALLGPALLAVASGLIRPSYRAYIADTTPEELRGRIFGLGETVINVAWIITPPIGGFLALNFGSRWIFIAASLIYSVTAIIFLRLSRSEVANSELPGERPSLASLRRSFGELIPLMFAGGLFTWILITDGIKDIAIKFSFDLMPIYVTEIAGFDKLDIGFLDGIHGVAWVVASPFGGWLVDKTSERLGVTVGLIMMMASPLVFAIATTYWGFALSWFLLGIGGAFIVPALDSLIARGVPTRLRGIAYGMVVSALGLISLPSPWIGSQLWVWLGPKAPVLLTVVLGSLAIIPAWFKLVVPAKKGSPSEENSDSQVEPSAPPR